MLMAGATTTGMVACHLPRLSSNVAAFSLVHLGHPQVIIRLTVRLQEEKRTPIKMTILKMCVAN